MLFKLLSNKPSADGRHNYVARCATIRWRGRQFALTPLNTRIETAEYGYIMDDILCRQGAI